jgi:hypothetical protein
MNYPVYHTLFDSILDGTHTDAPYDDPHYLEYIKLNKSRMHRWEKRGILAPETISTVQSISSPQNWVLITEPWCGDASHIVPFIAKMAELNPMITLQIQLRDSEDSEIDKYLTNGGKSIPKLIVRDEYGKDIFHWGPRPKVCQELYLSMKAGGLDFEAQKIALQNWYNRDEGKMIQEEVVSLLKK